MKGGNVLFAFLGVRGAPPAQHDQHTRQKQSKLNSQKEVGKKKQVGSREQFWHKISRVRNEPAAPDSPPAGTTHLSDCRSAFRFRLLLPLYKRAKANKKLCLVGMDVQDDLQDDQEVKLSCIKPTTTTMFLTHC